MCGVAGIFDYRGHSDTDRALLRRMTDILGHRGPDGDGFHFAPGVGCLDRFNGMFAFALWDAAREVLFLARDRLGEKPLYYSFLSDGRLLFASELKSLLLSPRIDRQLDPQAIEEFFAFGYVPDPRSIYRGVRKLAPAHYLHVRRGDPVPEPRAYWDVEFLDGA